MSPHPPPRDRTFAAARTHTAPGDQLCTNGGGTGWCVPPRRRQTACGAAFGGGLGGRNEAVMRPPGYPVVQAEYSRHAASVGEGGARVPCAVCHQVFTVCCRARAGGYCTAAAVCGSGGVGGGGREQDNYQKAKNVVSDGASEPRRRDDVHRGRTASSKCGPAVAARSGCECVPAAVASELARTRVVAVGVCARWRCARLRHLVRAVVTQVAAVLLLL